MATPASAGVVATDRLGCSEMDRSKGAEGMTRPRQEPKLHGRIALAGLPSGLPVKASWQGYQSGRLPSAWTRL